MIACLLLHGFMCWLPPLSSSPQPAAINLRCLGYPFHGDDSNEEGCQVGHSNRPVKKQKGEPLKTGATS